MNIPNWCVFPVYWDLAKVPGIWGCSKPSHSPSDPANSPGKGDTAGKFSNKGVWVREGCGMGSGHAVPTREQIPIASRNPGKGQPFPNSLDMARCKQPLWPPPYWLQGLPRDITASSETWMFPLSPSVPGAGLGAGHPAGLTCSQVNRDTPGWSWAESCRDWEWVEGGMGEEGMGRAQGA